MKMLFLKVRALCGHIWRLGLISRGTALRWELDASLGEYTSGRRT